MIKTIVRVISLKDDVDRRSRFALRSTNAEVAWSFFDARTQLAEQLTYDETRAIITRGRPLSRAEIGCYSSHYCTWLEFLQSDAEQLIVLEDDTLVDWGFLKQVCEHDFSANAVQFLRLASMATPPAVYKGEMLGRYLVQYLGMALGAQAYLLTRAGAEHLREYCRRLVCPIDDALDATWRGAPPNFGLYHHPVIEMAGPSRIGAARNSGYPMPTILKVRRLLFRATEKWRRLAYRLRVRLGMGPPVRGVDARWI